MNTLRVSLAVLVSVLSTTSLPAQSRSEPPKFKIGDKVAFLSGDDWVVGTLKRLDRSFSYVDVVDKQGNVREQFCGTNSLRFEWESRAMSGMRFWSDTSNKFRVKAAIVGIKNGQVTLHKEDDTEISVPISKLSVAGQAMIKKIQESYGPEVSDGIEATEFVVSSSAGSSPWGNVDSLAELTADPPPSYGKLPMKGVVFPKTYRQEQITLVRPIGGTAGWMMAATTDRNREQPCRVVWASLTEQKVKQMQRLPSSERVIDVAPSSRLILSVNESDRSSPILTIWNASPASDKAVPIKSWGSQVPKAGGGSRQPDGNWGAIISSDIVLHEWGRQQFVAWSIENEASLYQFQQESSASPTPVLSPGKRYIALPESKHVRLLDTTTGQTLAELPLGTNDAKAVAFSANGEKLAALTNTMLAVWTFGSSEAPQNFNAESVDSDRSGTLDWVTDQLFLIDDELLFDTRLEMGVWSYQSGSEVVRDGKSMDTKSIFDGMLCYAAEAPEYSSLVVGGTDLPGPMVNDVIAELTPDDKFAIDRGQRIALDIQCGQYDQQVRSSLEAQIQDNGWVNDSSSDTVLVAEMTRGETQSVTYQSFTNRSENLGSASVTPYISRMTIRKGKHSLWSSISVNGYLPMFLTLRNGETPQSYVEKTQKPDPEFFGTRKIPAQIIHPTVRRQGFGVSKVTNRGLQPKRTPPEQLGL